jgi:hypothetical protein
MAKAEYGPIVSDIRNKLGDYVFSRGIGGPFVRAWLKPTFPNSPSQAYANSCLQAVVQRWQQTLTDAQRSAWSKWGLSQKTHVPIGGGKPLPGFWAYVKINQPSYWQWGDFIDVPPTDQKVSTTTNLTIPTLQAYPMKLTAQLLGPGIAGENQMFFASPQLQAGRSWCWAKLCWIAAPNCPVSTAQDLTEAYCGQWGPILPNMRTGLQASIWRASNAARAMRMQASAVAANGPKTNLLLNGDFSLGPLGHLPTDWTQDLGNQLTVVEGVGQYKSYSASFQNATATLSSAHQDVSGLSPGNYILQAFIRADSLTGPGDGALIYVTDLPGGNLLTTSYNNQPIANYPNQSVTGIPVGGSMDTWIFCTMTFALPAAQTGLRTHLTLGYPSSNAGVSWYGFLVLCGPM